MFFGSAKWFRGALKHELWTESTEHFRTAFSVTCRKPKVRVRYEKS